MSGDGRDQADSKATFHERDYGLNLYRFLDDIRRKPCFPAGIDDCHVQHRRF